MGNKIEALKIELIPVSYLTVLLGTDFASIISNSKNIFDISVKCSYVLVNPSLLYDIYVLSHVHKSFGPLNPKYHFAFIQICYL